MAYEPNDQIARYNSALEKQLELLQESINQNKTLNQTIREQEEAEKEEEKHDRRQSDTHLFHVFRQSLDEQGNHVP